MMIIYRKNVNEEMISVYQVNEARKVNSTVRICTQYVKTRCGITTMMPAVLIQLGLVVMAVTIYSTVFGVCVWVSTVLRLIELMVKSTRMNYDTIQDMCYKLVANLKHLLPSKKRINEDISKNMTRAKWIYYMKIFGCLELKMTCRRFYDIYRQYIASILVVLFRVSYSTVVLLSATSLNDILQKAESKLANIELYIDFCSQINYVDGMKNEEIEKLVRTHGRFRSEKYTKRKNRKTVARRKKQKQCKKDIESIEKELEPISDEMNNSILKQTEQALKKVLPEMCCCVCDELKSIDKVKTFSYGDIDFFDAMHQRLVLPCEDNPDIRLPRELVSYYDCSEFEEGLKGIMLSKNGVHMDGGNDVMLEICNTCERSLKNMDTELPPKFSIANGFYIGQLPAQFTNMTWLEIAVCKLVTCTYRAHVVRGGAGRSIKEHITCYDATPYPAAHYLPTLLDANENGEISIVLAGAFTPEQKIRLSKIHRCRKEKIEKLYKWLKENNYIYKDLYMNEELLSQERLDEMVGNISTEISDNVEDFLTQMDADKDDIAVGDDERNEEIKRAVFTNCAINQDKVASLKVAANENGIGVIRGSNVLSTNMDENLLAKQFIDCFPYGRGTPNEIRDVPVSFEACLVHYNRLSNRTMSTTPGFIESTFDRNNLSKGYISTSVRAKFNNEDGKFAAVNEVNVQTLSDRINEYSNRRKAIQEGRSYNSSTYDGAAKLLREVNCSMGNMYGTPASQLKYKRQVWSYQAQFGSPTFFVTLSPDAGGSYSVYHNAGGISAKQLLSEEFDLNTLPSKSLIYKANLSDPAACQRYYNRIVETFFGVTVGFDKNMCESIKGGGLFGHCKAYFGMTEAQARTSLHLHCLLWIDGAPKTHKQFVDTYCTDVLKQQMMKEYLESVINHNVNLEQSDYPCMKCGAKGKIGPLDEIPGRAYFRPNNTSTCAPTLSSCSECNTEYSSIELLRYWIHLENEKQQRPLGDMSFDFEKLKALRNNSEDPIKRSEILCNVINRAVVVGRLRDSALRPLLMTAIKVACNEHKWQHHHSCFKHGKTCRYCKPGKVQETYELDNEAYIVQFSVKVGNEYMHGMNDVISWCYRMNHDVKPMVTGAEPDQIYYTVKYVVKTQETVDSVGHMAISSLERRIKKETARLEQDESVVKFRRRVNGLLHGITSKQEIACTMACQFLEHKSLLYCSHKMRKYLLSQYLMVTEDVFETNVKVEQGKTVYQSTLLDYMYRPEELSEFCSWDYDKAYKRALIKEKTQRKKFMEEHPNSDKYGVIEVKNAENYIFDIIGPRIPSVDDCGKRELYSRIFLCMFKPFRCYEDLLGDNESYEDAWNAYKDVLNDEHKQFVMNVEDYHIGKERARVYREHKKEYTQQILERYGVQVEDDDLGEVAKNYTENLVPIPARMYQYAKVKSRSICTNALLSGLIDVSIENSICKNRQISEQKQTDNDYIEIDDKLVMKELQKYIEDEANKESSNMSFNVKPLEVQKLTLEYDKPIRRIVNRTRYLKPKKEDIVKEPRTIEEVSHTYYLNEKQHIAFVLFCKTLIGSIIQRQTPWKKANMTYLGGEGGTGKSEVIHAFLNWAESNGLRDYVLVTAPTNKAAKLIGGNTVHSTFGFGVDNSEEQSAAELWIFGEREQMRSVKASLDKQKRLAKVKMVIIDECSFVSRRLLCKVSNELETMKNIAIPFGGVEIMFCGDFNQLPPVGGKAMYVKPQKGENRYEEKLKGFNLWQFPKAVVILEENMRIQKVTNPEKRNRIMEWTGYLKKARDGVWETEYVERLNSEHFVGDDSKNNVCVYGDYTPIITCTNSLKHAFNIQCMSKYAQKHKQSVYRIAAQFLCSENTKMTARDITKLYSLTDNKTGNMAAYLDVCVGSPVMVQQNLLRKKGIVKGTMGTVYEIVFETETEFKQQYDHIMGCNVIIPSKPPKIVYVDIWSATHERVNNLPDYMPDTVFPLTISQTIRPSYVKLSSATYSIKTRQLPFVLAYAMTCHKVQGESFEAVIIGAFREETPPYIGESAYVALSRCKNPHRLYTLQKFKNEWTDKLVPSKRTMEIRCDLDKADGMTVKYMIENDVVKI